MQEMLAILCLVCRTVCHPHEIVLWNVGNRRVTPYLQKQRIMQAIDPVGLNESQTRPFFFWRVYYPDADLQHKT